MKSLIQEYGLIIVSIIAIIICMTFGKNVFSYNIFDTTIDNVAKLNGAYEPGTVLRVDGYNGDLIVMKRTGINKYLVITSNTIGNIQYQPNQDENGNYTNLGKYESANSLRNDNMASNTYENSYIDNYLENTWYKSLPNTLQSAIVIKNIYQDGWQVVGSSNTKWRYFDPTGGTKNSVYYNEGTNDNPNWVRFDKATVDDDDGGMYPFSKYTNKTVDKAKDKVERHVYLPNVNEIRYLVDLSSANKTYAFLLGEPRNPSHIWLRDYRYNTNTSVVTLDWSRRCVTTDSVTWANIGVRPAFVLNTSKIKVKAINMVHYK